VLVIHENMGLTPFIRTVAARLAGAGYSTLAVDLLSEDGGTAAFTDPGAATAALAKIPPARFVADLRASITELGNRAPGRKLGVVGFCFGGGLVWQLLAAGEPRLAAAAPFYGPLPDSPDFSRSTAAVLGLYGDLDKRITTSRDAAAAALTKAGLAHDLVVEPAADHAFFNDTGARYQLAAASDAYRRLLEWFGRYLS
jgi:carboxymethylenebutenolidase